MNKCLKINNIDLPEKKINIILNHRTVNINIKNI